MTTDVLPLELQVPSRDARRNGLARLLVEVHLVELDDDPRAVAALEDLRRALTGRDSVAGES